MVLSVDISSTHPDGLSFFTNCLRYLIYYIEKLYKIFLEYFADFPVLRKVAKSLIYKGYYFEVTTKKTMNLIKKVIVLCYHVSKLSLTDHKKDPKKNPFFRVFFA